MLDQRNTVGHHKTSVRTLFFSVWPRARDRQPMFATLMGAKREEIAIRDFGAAKALSTGASIGGFTRDEVGMVH